MNQQQKPLGKITNLFRAAWLPLLIGLVGLLPFCTEKTFVGDLGDARFNMFMLEHGYKKLCDPKANFMDAPFFFPHKNIVAYSENHLGNLPFYAAFRILGSNREQAYQYWTLLSLALTYLSGYLALRSFGAQRLAASLAAYIFAFGLPVHAQIGHFQLLPRYLLPWVFVFASRLVASGRTRDFALIAVLMLGQMYIGIYNGLLTAVTLIAYLLVAVIFEDWRLITHRILGSHKTMALRGAIALIAALALLPIALPYLHAAQELGMRPLREISGMLPRVGTWLYPPDASILWGWIGRMDFSLLRGLPMPYEHRNFVGITMLLALLLWPFLKTPKSRLAAFANRAWWSVVFCFIITLSAGGVALWLLLLPVPGFGAIRGVTRIVLYMLFPMSMVLAVTLDHLIAWARAKWAGSPGGGVKLVALGCLLSAFVFTDSGVRTVVKTSFAASSQGVEQIKAEVRKINPQRNCAFWVCQRNAGDEYYKTELDAMLASQDLGIPTINGYSGSTPPDYQLQPVAHNETPEPYKLKGWLDSQTVPENTGIIVLANNRQVAWNPLPDYSLGTRIQLTKGPNEGYLGRGFAKMRESGIWTNKKWASLSLKVSELPKRDLTLAMSFDTAPPPKGQQNILRLKVNGTEIAAHYVNSAASFVWKAQIPQETAGRKNGILEIEVGSDVIIPIHDFQPKGEEWNPSGGILKKFLSKDRRAFGVFLKDFSIE